MTSPFIMLFLLLTFAAALALVLSGYREDEPRAILRGALRRGLTFCGAVLLVAAGAYFLSVKLLLPGA
jgi:hypothetical protein